MHRIAALFGLLTLACDAPAETASPEDAPPSAYDPVDSDETDETEETDGSESSGVTETVEVQGGLKDGQVQAVVDGEFREVKECFDLGLQRADDVNMTGAIIVKLTVDKAGKVSNSELESSKFGDEATEECLVELASGWKFPKPRGGKATVRYPFYLRSY